MTPSELRWSRPDSEGHIPAPTIRDVSRGFSWTGDDRTNSRYPSNRSSNESSQDPGQARQSTEKQDGVVLSGLSTSEVDALIEQEAEERAVRFKDPLIGTLLDGKYRILSVLGFGGMSVVYKAEQELIEKLVAVKTVKFRVDERPSLWQRFEREVKTLSRLSHPNIVTVYDCVMGSDHQPYVVMDYLEGKSLDQVLQELGRFNMRQLLSVASQACSAVGHAHRNNVIHRDIKPANIMLVAQRSSLSSQATTYGGGEAVDEEPQWQVKVVDFGLAKLGEDSRKLTQSGELWGSPPYMSPEQIIGGDCDGRSDIYSLGCVVYEMATGRDPFWSANVYELLHKHLNEEPPTIQEACPDAVFPPHLQAVLEKAMAKNPEDRFSTMLEFREALEAACTNTDEEAPPPVVRKPGQTNYRLPEMRNATARQTGNSLTPPGAAQGPQAGTGKSMQPQEPAPGAHAAESHHSNLYMTWTMTGLLLAACILFVFNETTRPPTYVKRRPYHVVNKSIPMAPVPPPVGPIHEVPGGRQARANPNPNQSAAADKSGRGRRHRLAESPEHHGRDREHRRDGEHEAVNKTNSKSASNSSAPAVDQSKFELLRQLKSAPMKNEGQE